MKKFTLLLFSLLLLESCSSISDLSYEDRDRGNYFFNQKLKSEYTKFFVDNVFKNGSYVYAGPSFLAFNNFQLIKLKSLTPSDAMPYSYKEKDGTVHEYSKHMLQPYYDGKNAEDVRTSRIEFDSAFQSFQQLETQKFKLIVELRCKKNVKCHLVPDVDFFLFKDPYDFTLKMDNEDLIITENVELANFTDTEASAISNRMIFEGMGQKAAELAIGKDNRNHYMHGYYNVSFKNEAVNQFEFRMRYDLHYFTRH